MKKIIFSLILGMTATHVGHAGVVCSKSYLGATYHANVSADGEKGNISISASNNKATRRGEQSEGPVAFQLFTKVNRSTIDGGRVEHKVLN